MGREIPPCSLSLLRWAERARLDMRIISDCNSVFINAMLVGEPPPVQGVQLPCLALWGAGSLAACLPTFVLQSCFEEHIAKQHLQKTMQCRIALRHSAPWTADPLPCSRLKSFKAGLRLQRWLYLSRPLGMCGRRKGERSGA